jgi:hypothetical protein
MGRRESRLPGCRFHSELKASEIMANDWLGLRHDIPRHNCCEDFGKHHSDRDGDDGWSHADTSLHFLPEIS